jgi:mannose-6-phosphate isomerase-like protein (cupin superfamily)
MLIKDLAKCSRITAIDDTCLCELLHPARDGLDLPYSIAHAELPPGISSVAHRLKESSEVYFILEGRGEMHIEQEQSEVGPGQAIFIAPGSWQYIRNTGNATLKFLCIVAPMWRSEDEELLVLYRPPGT